MTEALKPSELPDFLLATAVVRPVFIKGAPGIGKSALVAAFARSLGLDLVVLLGSQILPEDILGVPQIEAGRTRFCPPARIARATPYCLFLDELANASKEVQKALYPLIHDQRIDDWRMPPGSVVIAAGNRSEDHAFVNPVSSALINRMIVVELEPSVRDWLAWARGIGIHEHVIRYLETRPDHLWSLPGRHGEPFSTPRSWHALSDAMLSFGAALDSRRLLTLAKGTLSAAHAQSFAAFVKSIGRQWDVARLLKGEIGWPDRPEDRDALHFMAMALRARLAKDLPASADGQITGDQRQLAHRAKALISRLAEISAEAAQTLLAGEEGQADLPSWLLTEIVRDVPRLALARK